MSYQPPTSPLPNSSGSSPTKLRRRGGRFRWLLYVLAALFTGFIAIIIAALAFVPDEAFTTPATTVTVTTEGETKTVTITPEPKTTTVTKNVTVTPKPETKTVTVRPEPEVRTETKTVTVAPPAVAPGAGAGAGAGGGVDVDAPPAVAPYPNCTAVRNAGAAPISPGDPGWNPGLDRDGDGQACGDD